MQTEMATMMQQMQGSITRLAPEEGTIHNTSPHPSQGRTFFTPVHEQTPSYHPYLKDPLQSPPHTPPIPHLFPQTWANSRWTNSLYNHALQVFDKKTLSSSMLALTHQQKVPVPPTHSTPLQRINHNSTNLTPHANSSMIQHHKPNPMSTNTPDPTNPNTTSRPRKSYPYIQPKQDKPTTPLVLLPPT